MKKILVSFILPVILQFTNTLCAQNLNYEWGFNPDSEPLLGNNIWGHKTLVDDDGNMYVVGEFEDVAYMSTDTNDFYLISDGGIDAFFAKYDSNGQLIFAKKIGGGGDQIALSIDLDQNRNIYVCGNFQGTPDFDPGNNVSNLSSQGLTDGFIAKYDSSGNYLFAGAIGGTGADNSTSIKVDASGMILLTGSFSGTADFDPSVSVNSLVSNGSDDAFFAKYTHNGLYVFSKKIGGTVIDKSFAINSDINNNIYITGNFYGTCDFDPGAGTLNLTAAGNNDIFFARYDSAGNYTYAKRIGNTGSDVAYAIAVDELKNIYITGSYTGTTDFDPNAGIQNITANGNGDCFFAKYDSLGNYVLAKGFGGTSLDQSRDISIDANHDIYVSGFFWNTVDFDPNAGVNNITSNGSSDIFYGKYSASGQLIFAQKIGGTSSDEGHSIANWNSRCFITGFFKQSVDFDPGPLTQIYTSPYSLTNKAYIGCYDNQGNYIWAYYLGRGSNLASPDYCNRLLVRNNHLFALGGFYNTADFDPGPNTQNLSADAQDIFLAKYDLDGNYKFAFSLGGTSNDDGKMLAIDKEANIVLTGSYLYPGADLYPGPNTDYHASNGQHDIFFAKYDSLGNYIYGKSMGGTGDDQGYFIGTDRWNNIYIAGIFNGSVDFDPDTGTSILNATGQYDMFIAKYSSQGNFIFAQKFGNTAQDQLSSGFVDSLGNFYIAGSFYGSIDFDNGPGTHVLTSTSGGNGFFAAYDSAGNYIMAKVLGSTTASRIESITLDDEKNLYVGGTYSGTTDFDPSPGTFNLTAGLNMFIAKYDPNGNLIFVKPISNSVTALVNIYEVSIDQHKNIYCTGYYQNTVDFDPSGATYNLTAIANYDIFLAKYDTVGNLVFAKSFGNYNYDIGYSVQVDGYDKIYAGGKFLLYADMDPTPNVHVLQSVNSDDMYIVKYNQCEVASAPILPSSYTMCSPDSITLTLTGNLNNSSGWTWYEGQCGGMQIANGTTATFWVDSTTTFWIRGEGGCINNGTCSPVTVSIGDFAPPVIEELPDIMACTGTIISFQPPTATDNCYSTVTQISGLGSSVPYPLGTTTNIFVAADNAGNTDTSVFTVTIYSPSVSILSPFDTTCTGYGPVTLQGIPPGGSFSGNFVSGNTFNPALANVGINLITYSYTDSNACPGSDSLEIINLPCTSLDELPESQILQIFPNPNSGTFYVQLTEGESIMSARFFTVEGKSINFTQNGSNGIYFFDLGKLAPGTYHAVFQLDSGQFHRTVVIVEREG